MLFFKFPKFQNLLSIYVYLDIFSWIYICYYVVTPLNFLPLSNTIF